MAIQYDADYGYTLHVSGKSIKDILSQRIIWEPVDYDDTSLDAVMAILIRMNASDPVNYAGKLPSNSQNGTNRRGELEKCSHDTAGHSRSRSSTGKG